MFSVFNIKQLLLSRPRASGGGRYIHRGNLSADESVAVRLDLARGPFALPADDPRRVRNTRRVPGHRRAQPPRALEFNLVHRLVERGACGGDDRSGICGFGTAWPSVRRCTRAFYRRRRAGHFDSARCKLQASAARNVISY